ncbi:MAG: phosphoribosylaminoimidazolesuccinocarboxamide synthase [Selenomonadaceae bacterium]|nr:phosphoribosylaminoimidazolesuccinocarboxamide synthase [Selenomonadaceae bacterium]
MTAKAQAINMVELVPETDIPLVIEILKRFISYEENDDIATPEDIYSHELAMQEYRKGKTISHEAIEWD